MFPLIAELHEGRRREQLRNRCDPIDGRQEWPIAFAANVGEPKSLRPISSWSYTIPIDSPGCSRFSIVSRIQAVQHFESRRRRPADWRARSPCPARSTSPSINTPTTAQHNASTRPGRRWTARGAVSHFILHGRACNSTCRRRPPPLLAMPRVEPGLTRMSHYGMSR